MESFEMIIDPKEDRISHINVYSKSTTELGRKLTNFARMTTPTANDGVFASVEAYWYWLGVAENNPKRETLRAHLRLSRKGTRP